MSARSFRPSFVFAVLPVFASVARAQVIERVSVDNLGNEGDAGCLAPSISGDARFVAYESSSALLAPGDTNGVGDVFVRDRVLGITRIVSDGGQFESGHASISQDGQFVAFESWSENWLSTDQNGWLDVYVRDLAFGGFELVSVDSAGNQGNRASRNPSISADGRFVAFDSRAHLAAADTDFDLSDVYLRDRTLGTTTLLSVGNLGQNSTAPATHPAISGDGSFVAFECLDAFDPADTNGSTDIYVRDIVNGTTTLVSRHPTLGPGDAASYAPSISLDGSRIVFDSDAENLAAGGDTNHVRDIFLVDRIAGTCQRVSVGPGGVQSDGFSQRAAISGDGRFVSFESDATNLVAGDLNGVTDIFVYDTSNGTMHRMTVDGAYFEADSTSYFSALSFDGSACAFSSLASNLAPGDANLVEDVFVRTERPAFSVFCPGDGSGVPCPCGNDSAPGAGRGCLNSLGFGARLVASGEPRIGASDTLVLEVDGMTSSLALFVQGSAPANGGAGVALNDGLGCWAGQLVRLRTRPIVAGTSSYPQGVDPRISVLGGVLPGDTRYYQVVYRNSAMTYCPPATANTSNGIELTWTF